jgi:hypothetical protein
MVKFKASLFVKILSPSFSRRSESTRQSELHPEDESKLTTAITLLKINFLLHKVLYEMPRGGKANGKYLILLCRQH